MHNKIFMAIDDVTAIQDVYTMIDKTRGNIAGIKIGLELWYKFSREQIKNIIKYANAEVFIDLKFHDIPRTVSKAIAPILELKPKFVTIHASGGREMIKAAISQRDKISLETKIMCVTMLTSLSDEDIILFGLEIPSLEYVYKLAKLSIDSGADGIICSPHEVSYLKANIQSNFIAITPGIRFEKLTSDDQKRTMTPEEAINAGSDYLVMGRSLYTR